MIVHLVISETEADNMPLNALTVQELVKMGILREDGEETKHIPNPVTIRKYVKNG